MSQSTMVENFAISSGRVVHRWSCSSIRHYQNGKRMHAVMGSGPGDDYEWVDASFDPAEEHHERYRRCRVCSPDVPEFPEPPRRTTDKRVEALCYSDLGRESVDGVLTEVRVRPGWVTARFDDGPLVQLDPLAALTFYRRA